MIITHQSSAKIGSLPRARETRSKLDVGGYLTHL